MSNTVKKPYPIPPIKWLSGEKLNAQSLNERLQAFKDGVNPPKQKRPTPLGVGKLIPMVVKSAPISDWLVCHTWNGETEVEGTEDILVAKPPLLRPSVTTRSVTSPITDTFTYTYLSAFQRTSVNLSGQTMSQVIIPTYAVDDLIYVQLATSTEVFDDEDNPIYYVDVNVDGRFWARNPSA